MFTLPNLDLYKITESILSKSPVAGEASIQDISQRGTHSMRQVRLALRDVCNIPVYGGKFLMKNGGACTSKLTVAMTPLPPSLNA
ncbi:hypothetical protein FF38_03254 [Lucilia cuprina]|uniref:Uncharacterized protein n=1 Tax=Lucilia cuprina TaxID=7375 RepID=A0A0L0CJG7_LUCCU|nr:hypothetical protein FF38_03254 [Lucilia cuprina]